MLDAFDRLPTDTEEAAVERLEKTRSPVGLPGVWGAAMPALDFHRVMAASMMMAPLAFAQHSAMAMRRSRALMRHWGEEAVRCRSVGALIEVNRHFGERAMAMTAGEMMRFFEHSALMGRAAAAPDSLKLRDADVADVEEPAKKSA